MLYYNTVCPHCQTRVRELSNSAERGNEAKAAAVVHAHRPLAHTVY